MNRRDFARGASLLAIAAAAGGLLAGCGADDGEGDAPTPQPTPTPNPVATPLPTRRFVESVAVLSEPMLQLPTTDTVRVVWFTEFEGRDHAVRYGPALDREVRAVSRPMTRMYDDRGSNVRDRRFDGVTRRDVWRHEAVVGGLRAGERLPYVAISDDGREAMVSSRGTLQPLPAAGQPLRLLLTSDLQLKPMAAANYERVAERHAPIDGILFAGDLVNVPNRTSEWFDCARGNSPPFFAALQGTMAKWQPGSVYSGGPLLQNGWIFPILGNHEYSGRWRPTSGAWLDTMFNDPQPRWHAERRYAAEAARVNPTGDAAVRDRWIADESFETISYEEVFSLPQGPEGGRYYAQRLGDVFVIGLDVNRIWRTWRANVAGKFGEDPRTINDPSRWGFGDFQFWPFGQGSRQYAWLQEVLASESFRTARYRIVMAHQSVFGLGDNATPVMAQTQASFEYDDGTGNRAVLGPIAFPLDDATWNGRIQPLIDAGRLRYIKYDYPLAQDVWKNEIEPMLIAAGVQLVHVGHSHLWCRSTVGGMHYLETSNVGNTYGAYVADLPARRQGVVPSAADTADLTRFAWNQDDYPREGDPHDRQMAMPTLRNPMAELAGINPEPFVSSNEITSYTIFDSTTGIVASYAFDTRFPTRDPMKFDEFRLDVGDS